MYTHTPATCLQTFQPIHPPNPSYAHLLERMQKALALQERQQLDVSYAIPEAFPRKGVKKSVYIIIVLCIPHTSAEAHVVVVVVVPSPRIKSHYYYTTHY